LEWSSSSTTVFWNIQKMVFHNARHFSPFFGLILHISVASLLPLFCAWALTSFSGDYLALYFIN